MKTLTIVTFYFLGSVICQTPDVGRQPGRGGYHGQHSHGHSAVAGGNLITDAAAGQGNSGGTLSSTGATDTRLLPGTTGAQDTRLLPGLGSLLNVGANLFGQAIGAATQVGRWPYQPGYYPGYNPGYNPGFNPGFGGGYYQPGIGGYQQGFGGGFGGGFKPGFCPAIRPVCPPTRFFTQPITCYGDQFCTGTDKCCYDTCLEERVCKPIS